STIHTVAEKYYSSVTNCTFVELFGKYYITICYINKKSIKFRWDNDQSPTGNINFRYDVLREGKQFRTAMRQRNFDDIPRPKVVNGLHLAILRPILGIGRQANKIMVIIFFLLR